MAQRDAERRRQAARQETRRVEAVRCAHAAPHRAPDPPAQAPPACSHGDGSGGTAPRRLRGVRPAALGANVIPRSRIHGGPCGIEEPACTSRWTSGSCAATSLPAPSSTQSGIALGSTSTGPAPACVGALNCASAPSAMLGPRTAAKLDRPRINPESTPGRCGLGVRVASCLSVRCVDPAHNVGGLVHTFTVHFHCNAILCASCRT